MNKSNRILITGGGGYIGVVAVEELLKHGFEVKVLDTFYWGIEPLTHLKDKVELIKADIRDIKPQAVRGVRNVIHLAALSNDPMANYNPKANFEINTKATAKFAKLCKYSGVNKFIFGSSASIYYNGTNDNRLKKEESPVSPNSAYSLSKHKAEKEILRLAGGNFCPVIFRQGTVFGFSPRMRYDLVVNTMVKDALSNKKIVVLCKGKQWRPLIDIRDVAQAYLVALNAPAEKVRGQTFNLVYRNYKVLELAKIVRESLRELKYMGVKVAVDYSDRKDRSYRISGHKIKRILGWEPKISVEGSTIDMIKNIKKWGFTDFNNPRYFNIEWMKLLISVSDTLKRVNRIF